MEKKRSPLRVFLSVFVIIAIVHSAGYLITNYSPGSHPGTNAVSGLAIFKAADEQSSLPSLSEMLIILEWSAIILATVFFIMKQKIDLRKETIGLYITKRAYSSEKQQTDLDVLYEILKEQKHLKINSISKVFHIPESTALEWARVLQNGNLASIYYPQFAEPELILKDE